MKTNRANLLTKVEDIEYLMGWLDQKSGKKKMQPTLFLNLNPEEQKIVDMIKDLDAIAFDDLRAQLNFTQSKLAMTLLNLEMQSIIVSLPGKVYRLNE